MKPVRGTRFGSLMFDTSFISSGEVMDPQDKSIGRLGRVKRSEMSYFQVPGID